MSSSIYLRGNCHCLSVDLQFVERFSFNETSSKNQERLGTTISIDFTDTRSRTVISKSQKRYPTSLSNIVYELVCVCILFMYKHLYTCIYQVLIISDIMLYPSLTSIPTLKMQFPELQHNSFILFLKETHFNMNVIYGNSLKVQHFRKICRAST